MPYTFGMDYLRQHPYVGALAGACILLIIGTLIVQRRAAVVPLADPRAWGGAPSALLDPHAYPTQQNPVLTQLDYASSTTVTIPAAITIQQRTEGELEDELGDLLAQLVSYRPVGSTGTGVSGGSSAEAYAFIPGGLISVSSETTTRSDAQQALYDYGNEAGSAIRSYETANAGALIAVKNHAEDRHDAGKKEALRALARSLSAVGRALEAIEQVPEAARSANAALAASYRGIGGRLELVANAESDEQFLEAIAAYNAAVDHFTEQFIALATLFSAHRVTFAPHEDGSVFMFKNTGL